MIVDTNAFLGQYPFRQLTQRTAVELIGQMDAHAIDAALVSSLHAVFYRDTHRGNQELFEQITPFADRLFPIAAVNPTYVGWERDVDESIAAGAKAMTLWPEHHGYRLLDDHGRAAVTRIADSGLPIVLTQRLEDRRQRHRWDAAHDLTLADFIELAAAFPQQSFSLCNWAGVSGERLLTAGLRDRCLIDFARLQVLLTKDVSQLIQTMRIDSIAFGSHMPFDYLAPSLVKLANLQTMLPPLEYQKVAWANAAQFFSLPFAVQTSDE